MKFLACPEDVLWRVDTVGSTFEQNQLFFEDFGTPFCDTSDSHLAHNSGFWLLALFKDKILQKTWII